MKFPPFRIFAAALVFALYLPGCSDRPPPAPAEPSEEQVQMESPATPTYAIPEKGYKSILEYGLFADPKRQIPNEGVVTFDLNTDSFVDYATVRRFVMCPPGESGTYTEEGAMIFPENTVLAQTLSYPYDLRDPSLGEKLVETRVLIMRESAWEAVPYIWNGEGTDARRSVAGGIVEVFWIHHDGQTRDLRYLVPNKNECVRCHEDNFGDTIPIGISSRNLNRESADPHGALNQLAYLGREAVLSGVPADLSKVERLPRWNDPETGTVRERARAWLQVNCAFCHSPDGRGNVSGLDLRFHQADPVRFGVFKPPVAAGHGSEGLRFSIYPGRPDESFIIRRLLSLDPAAMMPPTGRRTSNLEAVELIRAWIAEMHIDEQEAEKLIAVQQENYEKMVKQGTWEEGEEED